MPQAVVHFREAPAMTATLPDTADRSPFAGDIHVTYRIEPEAKFRRRRVLKRLVVATALSSVAANLVVLVETVR